MYSFMYSMYRLIMYSCMYSLYTVILIHERRYKSSYHIQKYKHAKLFMHIILSQGFLGYTCYKGDLETKLTQEAYILK